MILSSGLRDLDDLSERLYLMCIVLKLYVADATCLIKIAYAAKLLNLRIFYYTMYALVFDCPFIKIFDC
jgi:hypothetical protein